MSVREVAEYLGVARPTVYRWARQGRFPVYKLAGGVARVRAEDLEAFLQEAEPLYGEPTGRAQRAGGQAAECAEGRLQEKAVREYNVPVGRRKAGSATDADRVWLESDLSGPLPPYEWGLGGPPKGKPVRYVPGVGLVIEEDKADGE